MSNPYAEIFKAPGAKAFASAGFFARMPIAMAPIGIVAMLSQTHGEYWLAGAVSAAYALTNALLAPQISRVVDRLGQARVLAPTTIIAVIAFAVLVLAANQGWPAWTLFAAALGASVMPSFPAMLRARWSELFRDRPELNTAFAFESAADELVYIAGASLSVGLSVSLFPEAGLVVSTILLALGGFAFIVQRATQPKTRSGAEASGASAIWQRPVQIITLALIFVGAIFATAEVSVVAITEELGQPGAASLVIGVYAVGSFVVGLIIGALNLKMALERQLAIALSVLAITAIPLLFVDNVPLLAVAVFVSGVAISPTFITAFGLVERRVPAAILTEGITWVVTGIGIGMALGAFLTGWVVDTYGPANGFWVSVIAAALALTTILLGQKTLAGGSDCADAHPQPAE
ncbi:MFS transporter [Devosia yakushimensis]|uniref:MFS transporter n=1 Tax=Devosia yakushimensis TaxID=470028 RepID=A0ABQ5U889_9HYPH|nr:MFS transporter [Devosia yakushimensis]GLQ08114.1 MFS transporter [Devosia yakushimensis]